MARYPKFKEAKLTIFNNSETPDKSFDKLMETHGDIVGKFSMRKESGDVSAMHKLREPKTSDFWYGFCRAWLKFEDEKTIISSLNVVLSKASELLNSNKRFDIDFDYNKKIRRSHTVWVAKAMRVGEFASSYHSCMLKSTTNKPIGFVSLAKRGDGLVGYITQDFDGKVKHIIHIPEFKNGLVSVGEFGIKDYTKMMSIIDEIEDEKKTPK